jgi:hypothetical protein
MLNGVPQKPIEGASMVYTFDDAKAPSKRRTQYFEMLGNRAIYNDGWVAATTPTVAPWVVSGTLPPVDAYKWELYNVADDFSEAVNLADKEPAKLRELQNLFLIEAAKYNVLPIDNSKVARLDVNLRPSLTAGRSEFVYYPGMVRIPEGSAPDFKNRSFHITADVEITDSGAEGMLITQGGRFNGWGLYLLAGKPVFHYNLAGVERATIAGANTMSRGKHTIVLDFKYVGPGVGGSATATLSVDGQKVAEGKIARTIPFRVSLDETLDIGEDTGTPVSEDYHVPFKFTGILNKVTVDISPTDKATEEQQQKGEWDAVTQLD